MDILNPKNLRQQAQTALRRGREPKKLIYAYAFINLGISAVVYLLNLWMNQQIGGTGGLDRVSGFTSASTEAVHNDEGCWCLVHKRSSQPKNSRRSHP